MSFQFTEYSAEETSQLRYIECVLAIGIACARQGHNKPSKLVESRDWLNKALETATLLNMVCAGERISSTLQLFKGESESCGGTVQGFIIISAHVYSMEAKSTLKLNVFLTFLPIKNIRCSTILTVKLFQSPNYSNFAVEYY